MAISLYDHSVANYLQTLNAVSGFLDKARKHLEENKYEMSEIVETRLYPDMLPFRFQIVSVVHHSLGAIEGVKAGLFAPPADRAPHDYSALQKLVGDARDTLGKIPRAEIDALEGKDVVFQMGPMKAPFAAENFILSFSLPNFYFHAATAYDILRMKGAPLGKRDFMGALRMKVT
jgi:hypothetical protein